MSSNHCVSRLLASSLHDMRNVLAIIRESAGLAQDVASLASGNSSDNHETLLSSLQGVQTGVQHGAALIEAMDYMAQMDCQQAGATNCDLFRVCQSFCLMAARSAKGFRMQLAAEETPEPVWAEIPVPVAYCALLDILDLCASVGGQVDLRLAATHWNKKAGIAIALSGGDNTPHVLAAMTGNPALESCGPAWVASLVACHDAEQRFFLSFRASQASGD